MSKVPPDLYSDILSRVFVESLLRFRCVCKAWRRIIDDPAFIKLHLHRQSDPGQLIFSDVTCNKRYTLSLDSLGCCSSETPSRTDVFASPLETWIRYAGTDVPRISTFPVASCNGLILMSISTNIEKWAVLWNPFTREVHKLPSYTTILSKNQEVGSSCTAFGYDSVTDDYKVVKIAKCHNQKDQTLVYSLKSNSWRRVKDCPHNVSCTGVFVNGALHWISVMNDELPILAFDLATEDYYTLPLPPEIIKSRLVSPYILDALGECLLVTWEGSVYRLDDYGGKNLWTKLFSFFDSVFTYIRPIAYLKTKGEVLLKDYYNNNSYVWVNIEKKSARKVTIYGVERRWFSNICLASLVRLRKIKRGKNKCAKKVTIYGEERNLLRRNSQICLAITRSEEKCPKDRLKLIVRANSGVHRHRYFMYSFLISDSVFS